MFPQLIFNADGTSDVGHYKAHACPHDDRADASENIGKYICGTLNLAVKLFQSIKLCAFLFGLLSSDFLYEKILVVPIHKITSF